MWLFQEICLGEGEESKSPKTQNSFLLHVGKSFGSPIRECFKNANAMVLTLCSFTLFAPAADNLVLCPHV